jgi:hypothetical protein
MRYLGGWLEAGEKLIRAQDKLLSIVGEHDRRLAGGERRPPRDFIAAAAEIDLLADTELPQLQVIGGGNNLFHNPQRSYHIRER